MISVSGAEVLYQATILNSDLSEFDQACETYCFFILWKEACVTFSYSGKGHQVKTSNVHSSVAGLFFFFFFLNEKGSSCPTFPRVADTNEHSFITVIKPAGRLFLQVAVLLVNDRPSAWGMVTFRWLYGQQCVHMTVYQSLGPLIPPLIST